MSNKKEIEYVVIDKELEEGKKIYQSNESMRSFSNVACHPEFQQFFDTFFNTWEDCKVSIMILKTASFIRQKYKLENGKEIDGYRLLAILKRSLDNASTRSSVVDSIMKFSEDETINSMDDVPFIPNLK